MSENIINDMTKKAALWAKSKNRFIDDELLARIDEISHTEADKFEDMGIIGLEDSGKVFFYNIAGEKHGNVPIQEAEGVNFFSQVAPCTNNLIFKGAFKKGVEAGEMDLLFPYTFTYRMRPTPVQVHLYRQKSSDKNWVFIKWR